MYKKQLLLLFGLFVSSLLFAQGGGKEITYTNDELSIDGYKIKLTFSIGASYGFVVGKGETQIVTKQFNPNANNTFGFITKEDAFSVAKWFINYNKQTGKIPEENELKKAIKELKIAM